MAGWTRQKAMAYKAAFYDFLKHILIDSKEQGGSYCLADGLYDAQIRLIDGIFEGLCNDIHDYKILKSRQLGISTISEALFVFFLGMIPGIQAACVFDTAGHLKTARMRIKNLIKRLPKSLKYPAIVEDSRDLLALSSGASVVWMAAGVRETESSGGLGRSTGINFLWGSEVSSWRNDEGITSLIETLSESFEDRLYIWESTARGYNQWHEMWLEAKKDDLGQKAIFIGWWAHPLHVIKKSDRRFDRYGVKEPSKEESQVIAKVKSEYNHDITIEQLAWHRFKMDPTREADEGEKKGGQFKIQEQPSVEEECFTQAGSSFFDHVALNQHAQRLITFPKSKNYRYLFGTEFPQTIIVPATFWREVQLRVWDTPEPGVQYIVSADPAYGRNPDNDRSAVQVLACYADCVEQVAEYASPTTNTTEFAWVIASIAAWYKNVAVIIELDGPGEAVWKEYEGIPRLVRSAYMRQSAEERGLVDVFNNVRNYVFQRPDAMTGRGNNWQWKTGNRKEAIMEKLRAFVQTGQIIIKSMDTLDEMRAIARDGASIEAPSHKHDDRVLALAFGLRAWEDEMRNSLMAKGRTKEAHIASLKMTSAARYDIFMTNTISNMFQSNARQAKQAARMQRQAQMRRR